MVGEDTSASKGPFGDARATMVRRLRARRAEIDQAIFARVSGQWFDRTGSGDPEYVAGLRAAGVAALDYVLVGIERSGCSLEPVPAAALAQARRAARTGVGLDTVLRRYLAGYAVLEGFVMQEAGHDGKDGVPWIGSDPPSALRDLLGIISTLTDRLITAVSSAYSKEVRSTEAKPVRRAAVARSERSAPRERILQAMVEVVAERGFAGASVKLVSTRAGVSSRTFYGCFEGLEGCFVAILDQGMALMAEVMAQAFARERFWLDGLLGAEAAVLQCLDGEPQMARVLLVEALGAGAWALEHRERNVRALRELILEQWRDAPPQGDFRPLAASGVMASILGIIQDHLVRREPAPLISLLGPLMGVITGPYLDADDVAREVRRGEELARRIMAGESTWAPAPAAARETGPGVVLPPMFANPSAHRARECLLFLAEHPHSSNREIATGIGIAHQSQISRLLAYFTNEGFVVKRSEGAGKRNTSALTPHGEEIARALVERRDHFRPARP